MIELNKEQLKLRNELTDINSTLHSDLVKLVNDRFSFSYRQMSGRYEAWRKNERQHLAYVDPDEVDKAGKKLFTQARDIVVPYTYAVMQTRLTYYFFSMIGKSPLVPITGRGPNDVVPAKLMEIVQDYQMGETKAAAVWYCFLQDAERYGVGIIRNLWHSFEEQRWTLVRKPINVLWWQVGEKLIREKSRQVIYEGNLPTNVSPYNFFPDPRVNIADVKQYEYWGHIINRSYNYLKMAEANGEYFNIDKIPLVSKDNQNKTFEEDRVNTESDLGKIVNVTGITGLMTDPSTNATKDSANIKLKEMEIRLIPKDHDLSNEKYPEYWMISIANDQIVIKAEPLIYPEFSCYVGESNHDYAAPMNLSTVDMANGLADHLSWLYNSHMANVRKIINNSVVVDPSLIQLEDLLSDNPVKIIRLKEDAWGRPDAVRNSIQQLQMNDITRGHIQDSQIVMNLIQRVTAATDNIMGMVEEVKRTATETSSTINLATARLKLIAMLYFVLAIKPMNKAQIQNNQGFLSEERWYRITDDTALNLGYDPQDIKNRIFVKPTDLFGNFDYDIPSFDIPIDKINLAKVWTDVIQKTISNPILSQKFDIVPMFRQFLYNVGVTNSKDFEVKTKVLPDAQVQQMAQNGSLAPLNDVANINQQQMMDKMQEFMNGSGQSGLPQQ